jgi:1,5-anhydro-D-fructose reductase (1,5-anhydro-D-mannitol-forming)
MVNKMRWGMVGCGEVVETKSGPAFAAARGSRLVAVMSRDGSRAKDFAERYDVPRWHSDAEIIFEAEDIDAVYIATPTSSHYELALRCAAAGKHVYVEKPIAMTYDQSKRMAEACHIAGVKLWVAYYRRALPRLLKIKELMESEVIGKILLVRSETFKRPPTEDLSSWRLDPDVSGGGLFFEGMCHTLDYWDFLFGPMINVHGLAASESGAYKAEDTVVASWQFSSGVLGSGAWCFASHHERNSDEIVGTTGVIRFSIADPAPIVVDSLEKRSTIRTSNPTLVQQPLIQSIVDEFHGKGHCPSSGASALRTAQTVESILCDAKGRSSS